MKSLIHFFPKVGTVGGVETMIRFHLANDQRIGIKSQLITLFDEDPIAENHICLAASGKNSTWQLRAKLEKIFKQLPDSTVIYHNLWGIRLFNNIDLAKHRIGFIHSDSPPMVDQFMRDRSLCDGFVVTGQHLATTLDKVDIVSGERRIFPIRYPVPNAWFESIPNFPKKNPNIIIGFSGRLVTEQKHAERLHSFMTMLVKVDASIRLQVVGEGHLEPLLKEKLAHLPQVEFLGRKTGSEYISIVSGWDLIFCCSDYETGPLAVLEAMSLGVIPIYPEIPSLALEPAKKVFASGVYRINNLSKAVEAVQDFSLMSAAEQELLRLGSRTSMIDFSETNYLHSFGKTLNDIARLPHNFASSCPNIFKQCLPLGILRRVSPRSII